MAFVTVKGYDVEHASNLLVYENLFPEIQHINGKGCIDKYTKSADVDSVTYIDVMRVLPYLPRFRQLGATNNGNYHNSVNNGYGNAPQSTHYTIPVDLIYDEGVAITQTQIYSNPVALKQVVLAQLVKTAGMAINIITYAKQIEAFFRNGDNFDKSKTHSKGSVVAGDISDAEMSKALYTYATGTANDCVEKFLLANADLTDGVPEIGAFAIPIEERQAFITPRFDVKMKGQYQSNASDVSAMINATGFINPFTNNAGSRVDSRTGACGMYDGVDMFLFTSVTKKFVYVALGILGTADDTAGNLPDCRTALDKIDAIIVYGAGTCRGIVGPSIEANPNTYFGGVYILPKMKVGVEVLHGATIKMVINGGSDGTSGIAKADVVKLVNTLTFTPIDGSVVKGNSVVAGFNDGTTN